MKQIHGPNISDRIVRTDIAYSRPVHLVSKTHFECRRQAIQAKAISLDLNSNLPWIARMNRVSRAGQNMVQRRKMVSLATESVTRQKSRDDEGNKSF